MDRYKILQSDPARKPILKEKRLIIGCPECKGYGQEFELKMCTKCGGVGKISIPMHACQICGDETGQCKHTCSICGATSEQCDHVRPLSDKEMIQRYNNNYGELNRFMDEWRGHINNTYIGRVDNFSISQTSEPVPGTGILSTAEDVEENRHRIMSALGIPPEYLNPDK
jgi:RecJ-like exonuclease